VDKCMVLTNTRVIKKSGGKSGDWEWDHKRGERIVTRQPGQRQNSKDDASKQAPLTTEDSVDLSPSPKVPDTEAWGEQSREDTETEAEEAPKPRSLLADFEIPDDDWEHRTIHERTVALKVQGEAEENPKLRFYQAMPDPRPQPEDDLEQELRALEMQAQQIKHKEIQQTVWEGNDPSSTKGPVTAEDFLLRRKERVIKRSAISQGPEMMTAAWRVQISAADG